jgi:hypothetical protein
VAVFGLLLFGQMLWVTRELAPAFARGLDQAQPWLALWRAAVFLLLIGGWPWWVEWWVRHGAWLSAQQAFVLAQRWRVAAWLLVIELILVQRVLVRFVEAIAG